MFVVTVFFSQQVASGDASVDCVDGGTEPVDFETLFKLRLSDKLDTLFANNPDLPTQFVLVPSLRDVFHEFVYPQVRAVLDTVTGVIHVFG